MALVLPELVGAGDRLLTHPRVAELYAEYLFAMHCIIRASVPLMQAARERALTMGETDPVAAGLADYLGTHIPEEMHHDDWLLRDLEVLGSDRDVVLARIPSLAVARLAVLLDLPRPSGSAARLHRGTRGVSAFQEPDRRPDCPDRPCPQGVPHPQRPQRA
jgi:hypothetical protein